MSGGSWKLLPPRMEIWSPPHGPILLRYQIPRHYTLQPIDGGSRGLKPSRYQTFEELAAYSYGVASTAVLMCMYIVGFKGRETIPHAIKLGIALQLTSILCDVGKDHCNGRVYRRRRPAHV